jgi:hypothetical protein
VEKSGTHPFGKVTILSLSTDIHSTITKQKADLLYEKAGFQQIDNN